MSCLCTGLSGCGCNICAPANTIYRGTCTDPGSNPFLTYLAGFDPQFCVTRLEGAVGLLQSRLDGSGNFNITFTENIVLDLPDVQAVQNVVIPDLIVVDANNAWFRLLAPAASGLTLQTNAAGKWFIAPFPVATVPDPLTIGTLNVTNAATIAALTLTGAFTASGIAAGTPTDYLALNGNTVVKQSVALSSVQSVMFFEAPTSPSATTPNSPATSGGLLTIGNELYCSTTAGSLITALNSQTLSVVADGNYNIDFSGFGAANGGTVVSAGMQLLINGLVVNNGNTNVSKYPTAPANRAAMAITGFESRRLTAGTTIQLQVTPGSGGNISFYEVRLRATRLGS